MIDAPARNTRPDPAEARRRLGEAATSLLGWGLAGIVALGALAIWHLVRRGRLIRDGLAPPRDVQLPEIPDGFPRDKS
ncbi:hypothetical protein EP7_003299 [Isosphaeraceae bacterium EP7]